MAAYNIKITINNLIEANLTDTSARAIKFNFGYHNIFSFSNPVIESRLGASLDGVVAELSCFSPLDSGEQNAVDYIVNTWIPTYGYQRRIPVSIEFVNFGLKISNLWGSFSGSKGYEYDEPNQLLRLPIFYNTASFSEKAGSLDLRKLWKNDEIPLNERFDQDVKIIRYVIQRKNDKELATEYGFQGIVFFYIVKDYIEMGKAISVSFTALISNPFNAGAAIALGVYVGLYIAAGIAIINQITSWAKDVSNAVFEKPKAYYCLNATTIFTKAINQILGNDYTFQSSILESDLLDELHYLPQTTKEGKITSNPTNNPVPDMSFSEFISRMSGAFGNAKLFIDNDNKIVYFEQIETLQNNSTLDFTPQDLDQSGSNIYNIDELPGSIKIRGDIEARDLQVQKIEGIRVYNVTDNDGASLEGNKTDINTTIERDLGFTFARRKTKETQAEKAFNKIWDWVKKIGVGGNYKVNSSSRINYMVLSEDGFNADKIFIKQSNSEKIDPLQSSVLSIGNLLSTYWDKSGAFENQYKEISGRDSEQLCTSSIIQGLINNPFFNLGEQKGIILDMDYDENTELFNLVYRVKESFINTENLVVSQTVQEIDDDE